MSSQPEDLKSLWQNQTVPPSGASLDQVRTKASKFQRRIGWRNLREYAAAALVVFVFGVYFWKFDKIGMRVGSLLVIAGAVYMSWQLRKHGSVRPAPADLALKPWIEFQREELTKQRDLLRNVWSWYLLPFAPGLAIFVIGGALGQPLSRWGLPAGLLIVFALFFWLIAKLNHWAARKLQAEIDELNALERNS